MLIPDAPPAGRLEFMPALAHAATATSALGNVTLRAWVPGFEMDLEACGESEESFREDNCVGCSYYFDSYELTHTELDEVKITGLPDWAGEAASITVYSACPASDDGIGEVSFPCRAGCDGPSDEVGGSYTGPPMLFELTFKALPRSRSVYWQSAESRAWAQAAYVTTSADGVPLLCLAGNERSLNIHGEGEICWGDNPAPVDLASTVESYAYSKFNDDLMSYSDFHDVRNRMRSVESYLRSSQGESSNPSQRTKQFVHGRYNAMLVVEPIGHASCHALLRAMGAKPQDDGLLVLPLMWHDQRDEAVLISPPLGCGVSVLVRPGPNNTGLIIGQAPCVNTVSPSPVLSPELAHV
jgi:hypothetical protein